MILHADSHDPATTLEKVGLTIVNQIDKNLLEDGGGIIKLMGIRLDLVWQPDIRTSANSLVPGYQGRVWLLFSNPPHLLNIDVFKNTHMHIKQGGFGSYGGPYLPDDGYPVSYVCQLFDQDWPDLHEYTQVELAMRKLENLTAPFRILIDWSPTVGLREANSPKPFTL